MNRFKTFGQLMDAAKSGLDEFAIVEYRGQDVKCIFATSFDTFIPNENGVICLYNKDAFRVCACFDHVAHEIKDVVDTVRIINATGHDLHMLDEGNRCIRIIHANPSLTIRMQEEVLKCPDIDGIRVVTKEYHRLDTLPQQAKDVYYVVSWIVKAAYKDRKDFLCVDELVYDNGKPIGCRRLRR